MQDISVSETSHKSEPLLTGEPLAQPGEYVRGHAGRLLRAFQKSESPFAFFTLIGVSLGLLMVVRGFIGLMSHDEALTRQTTAQEEAGVEAPQPLNSKVATEAGQLINQPLATAAPAKPVISYERQTYKVRNGETLSLLLKRAGFNGRARHDIAAAFATKLDLRKIRPGEKFSVSRPTTKRQLGEKAIPVLIETRRTFDEVLTVNWVKNGDINLSSRAVDTTSELKVAEGIIEDSLFLSANKAGVPLDITIAIANIYAFSVDFQRDLRRGDQFQILYRERYAPEFDDRQAEKLVFSTLTLRGKEHDAIWHVDAQGRGGYYDRGGASARRALLKTPVDGARLTSNYGFRKHPILGYRKMHRGLDFGAPRGTPVKAAGDGVIEIAKRDRINGNFVKIRHGNGYHTGYAHLHRFKKGMRKGRKVSQGDIIGYVGSTGRATGPHLHYVVYKGGKMINPSTLKLPRARQLNGEELRRFQDSTASLMATYQQRRRQLADNSISTDSAGS